jgi:hypothetical protein
MLWAKSWILSLSPDVADQITFPSGSSTWTVADPKTLASHTASRTSPFITQFTTAFASVVTSIVEA